MSPSLEFDDVAATGPAPDVWATVASGLIICALAVLGSGIAYSFAFEGSTRLRIESASELGAGPITAALVLGGVVAMFEASRRHQESVRGGAVAVALILALVVVAGVLYSIWHIVTIEIPSSQHLGNTGWRRTAFALSRLAAGLVATAAVLLVLRRPTETSVEVA
jgi:hypothetical protein